jgi:hypothetical protein
LPHIDAVPPVAQPSIFAQPPVSVLPSEDPSLDSSTDDDETSDEPSALASVDDVVVDALELDVPALLLPSASVPLPSASASSPHARSPPAAAAAPIVWSIRRRVGWEMERRKAKRCIATL